MATQCWIHPNDPTKKVYCLDTVAPNRSPAPAGNAVVPAGYIRQMGQDGYRDTGSIYISGQAMPAITVAGIPYYTGILSPVIGFDPAAGQPFHTKPSYNPILGIID